VQAACVELTADSEISEGAALIEIEVRLRLDHGPAALAALDASGLVLDEGVMQDDQAYAPLGWGYGECRLGVTFARLRTACGQHWFTVKRPITDVRTCIEYQCCVSDREAMHHAILLMGFRPTVRIVKTRRSGKIGELKVCLDDVHGLGLFLEMEALARPGDDLTKVRGNLDALIEALDVPAERCFDTYDALIHDSPPQLRLVV
jgi:adenylate cyclase, class 2